MIEPLSIRRARWFEFPLVFMALGAIYLALMAGTRTLDLFTHPLWLDEVLTATLSSDASFGHMIAAIRGGVETNPPLLYLMLWPISHLLHRPLTNLELRAFAMLWMLIALTGVYALCRRRFARAASAIAVVAIAMHPLILNLAVEARFYAPWLALTVLHCLALERHSEKPTVLRMLITCVLALFVATIHWFGIIGLGLISVGDLIANRRLKRLIPLAPAIVALLTCVPFYLGQRSGLSVKTWVDPLNASDLRDELVGLFGAPSFLFVAIVSTVGALLMRRVTHPGEVTEIGSDEIANDRVNPELKPMSFSPGFVSSSLPFLALLTFPFVLIAFSIVVQPAFVARYLVLAIAPLALLAAYWSSDIDRRTIAVLFVGLFALGGAETIARSHAARGLDVGFMDAVVAIETKTAADDLIVFKRRREMYPVLHLRPAWEERVKQLDFGNDNPSPAITVMSKYERDIGRKVVVQYPRFGLIDLDALRHRGKPFYIVVPLEELDELRTQLPGFAIEDIGSGQLRRAIPLADAATVPSTQPAPPASSAGG